MSRSSITEPLTDEKTRKYYTFYIYGFHNKQLTFCLHLSNHNSCMQIFSMIERLTKIPTKLQMLSYRNSIISPSNLAHSYGFADENSIYLSVRGHGGGLSDDS